MVCEGSTHCIIQNLMPDAPSKKITLLVRPSYTISRLFEDIRRQMDITEKFDILLTTSKDSDEVTITENDNQTLGNIGIKFTQEKSRTTMKLVPASPTVQLKRRSAIVSTSEADSTVTNPSDYDELALGTSASPVEATTSSPIPITLIEETSLSCNNDSVGLYSNMMSNYKSPTRSSSGYVGLVNQAMTCYLNSLLQTLYMTPEFRNALYNWEYKPDGTDPGKNIPYQLQRLFLSLQTSTKLSVETTDLTRSFGWDSSDSWQQHDIQELCRVMFDTLEQKFKGTDQADFINRLYEGKMIDYVKCLECSVEKSREDTFLDIPLPVRPFGSTTAYGSVEEALKAFVEPETLDGNNQYFCEKCNKKCDAHKGLKFSKFPYILTLHLKRFDFDYQTFHRIKLNDKVTFPQVLNLNCFVKNNEANTSSFVSSNNAPQLTACDTTSSEHGSVESAIKCDDCSTTDSGSILEEEVGTSSSVGGHIKTEIEGPDEDEGIDMSTTVDNKSILPNEPGPFTYELFSINIHSGSASGGHYYAYIKEFDNDEWFCFNDQSVTPINQEAIEKSYGGCGSARSFYSSAYSSSTNAYMLMYRQIDSRQNARAMKAEEFPEHIEQLQKTIKEDSERRFHTKDSTMKYKVHRFDPRTQSTNSLRIFMGSDGTLLEAVEHAQRRLKLSDVVPIERCRLVAYDSTEENVVCSFDGKESECLVDLLQDLEPTSELLFEMRAEDETFEVYKPGSIETRVFLVDSLSSDISGPINVRVAKNATIGRYKQLLAEKLNYNVEDLAVSVQKYAPIILEVDKNSICDEEITHKTKVYVAIKSLSTFDEKKFLKIVELSQNIISLHFSLPKTDKDTLEKLSIPSYDPTTANRSSPSLYNNNVSSSSFQSPPQSRQFKGIDEVDAIMSSPPTVQYVNVHAQQVHNLHPHHHHHQSHHHPMEPESNSEDSSLSDGDRTLVGDVSPMMSASNSPACSDQQLSSPEDHTRTNGYHNGDDDTDMMEVGQPKPYYFKAQHYEVPNTSESDEPLRMLDVFVHQHMTVSSLKRALEPFIKVPMEFFKIFKMGATQMEVEVTNLSFDLTSFKDGERLTIELGRALRNGEYKCKVHYLKLSENIDEMEKMPFLCDWILCNGASIGKTKREILAHISTIEPKYEIAYERCRLRKLNLRSPGKVYVDDQRFSEYDGLTSDMQIILQELDGPVNDCEDCPTIFVRRWNPSEMTLGPVEELTLRPNDEIKNLLSNLSGIEEENIEYAKVTGSFLRSTISILDVHQSLKWWTGVSTTNDFPMQEAFDGNTYYYRDKTEQLKELTSSERQELKNQELNLNYDSISSRRRERALKIYVESSPNKSYELN